jgi:hypothetical protein
MPEPTLFDVEPLPAAEPAPKLSADARRAIRQREAITAGWHPLGLSPNVRHLKLHADAARVTHPGVEAEGLRCGSCRYRIQFGHHNRAYAKCTWGGKPYQRLTHGPGTDVRAWWPACIDYEVSA